MTQPRSFWRRLSDILGLPLAQWLMAFAPATISLLFLYRDLGVPAIWMVLAVPIVVGVCSWLASRGRNISEPEDATEELIRAIDHYCAQIESRRAQRPWLLASLVAYLCAFLQFVYGYADGYLDRSDWIDILIAVTIAIASMLRVGVLSEDNPPEMGVDKALTALFRYRHDALCDTRYQKLMSKLQHESWTMEDLVKFAAAEDQDNRRRKLGGRRRSLKAVQRS